MMFGLLESITVVAATMVGVAVRFMFDTAIFVVLVMGHFNCIEGIFGAEQWRCALVRVFIIFRLFFSRPLSSLRFLVLWLSSVVHGLPSVLRSISLTFRGSPSRVQFGYSKWDLRAYYWTQRCRQRQKRLVRFFLEINLSTPCRLRKYDVLECDRGLGRELSKRSDCVVCGE